MSVLRLTRKLSIGPMLLRTEYKRNYVISYGFKCYRNTIYRSTRYDEFNVVLPNRRRIILIHNKILAVRRNGTIFLSKGEHFYKYLPATYAFTPASIFVSYPVN